MRREILFFAVGAALTGLAVGQAKAAPPHWFYDSYGYYEYRTYGPETYYEEDAYIRARQRAKRRARMRRWLKQRRFRARTRADREYARKYGHIPDVNGNRFGPGRANLPYPPYGFGQKPPRKRVKLVYVPIPREKPIDLIERTALVTPDKPALKRKTPPRRVVSIPDDKNMTLDKRPRLAAWSPNPPKIEVKPLPEVPAKKAEKPEVKKPVTKAVSKPKVVTSPVKPAPKIVKKDTGQDKVVPKIRISVDKSVKPATKPQPKQVDRKRETRLANSISCSKARKIVSEFGFGDIRTLSCTGREYGFEAQRDGKPYRIRLSALSGELTSVKRGK